ncbi:MAG: adenylosuccinate synthase, partial [Bacillota bacterium]
MPAVAIVGAQWGDEGKGKITDMLAARAHVVARYSGGNNAGHTVKIGDEVFKLKLIPSGILYKDKINVIGNGVVVDPAYLVEEMGYLEGKGVDLGGLRISEKAHVIMPYHILIEKLEEEEKGAARIGATGRGIGPTYTDKVARLGVRIVDLVDRDALSARLDVVLPIKNRVIEKVYGARGFAKDELMEWCQTYAERIKEHVTDTSALLNEAIDKGQNVLFEGAQGTLLDVDHGTYPYVTSSSPTAGGIAPGTGVGPRKITKVIGVTKAYTSRVGMGPMPTELKDETGDKIRQRGQEYGTVTGRPRRCGWFDAVIVRYAARVNGLDGIAVTHLDTLSGFSTVKVCTAYRYKGRILKDFPANQAIFAECEPVYEDLPGWPEGSCKVTTYDDLPANARSYLARVSELVGAPAVIVSTGRERTETLVLG